jgi:type I restriction enzyme S subunit
VKKWVPKRLDDIADFHLGKMLDAQKNRGEPLPYLANVDVRWGSFDLDNLRQMRFEYDEAERYGLKYGDIVMCEGGEPGRCAIWKDAVPGMMIQKALHRIRTHEGVDHRFLFYSFLHLGRTGGFAPLFTGATIKHLPRQQLAKLEVALPALPVQSRIASILSAYDDLIENNTRRIALLEQAARLLYEEWFVRLRFPGSRAGASAKADGREHTRIVDGVPKGWKRCRLDTVAEVNRETLSGKHDGQIEYVDIASVTPGEIGATTTYDYRDAPSRARRVVHHGDIIWSCVRPNRRSHAIVWNPPDNLVASTGFAVITPTAVPTSYLYWATTTDAFAGYLVNRARGAAYPAVVAGDFEEAEIIIPPASLIEAFDDFAQPAVAQAQTLRAQNRKLKAARDLLLARLMSGEMTI